MIQYAVAWQKDSDNLGDDLRTLAAMELLPRVDRVLDAGRLDMPQEDLCEDDRVVALLCGSVLGVKQVGGICGALLTNLSAWLSGVWFDLKLVGGAFERLAHALPFVHAVELEKALFGGDPGLAAVHILPVLLYAAGATAAAVLCFLGQMKRQ